MAYKIDHQHKATLKTDEYYNKKNKGIKTGIFLGNSTTVSPQFH